MKNLFNIDNPVWRFMGKLTDLAVLSGLWVLFSLPVVTVGPATAALYYVTLKLANDEEGYTVRSFFHGFRENLIPGIPLGIGAVFVGIFLGCDLYLYSRIEGQAGTLLLCVTVIFAAVYLMILFYLFPLLARCDTDWKHLLAMAFVMSVKNFGWTLLMIVTTVCFLAIGLFVLAPILIAAIGGAAYIHSKILNMLLKEYQLGLCSE
ncbi:MAG TPA: DUF624 domain-containing protein [Candidatus Blautia merdavium]|uniref:DUF624 domain-containing protein n=1 Tax=Candidatus Blautia merdavium TaxID=2838494 RepID=A0A9D2PKG5_9FIRM|nr:DUF624 domain-containing protein [Candidatus Blautia merdavium]